MEEEFSCVPLYVESEPPICWYLNGEGDEVKGVELSRVGLVPS